MAKKLTRRALLGSAAALGTGSAKADSPFPLEIPPWTLQQGFYPPHYGYPSEMVVNGVPGGLLPAAPVNGPPEKALRRSLEPENTLHPDYGNPIQHQLGTLTPNGLFYVVAHGGLPLIDTSQHLLLVHSDEPDLLRRPMVFTVPELQRFPSQSILKFMECSGNTWLGWDSGGSKEDSAQLLYGLASGTEWTGVPVRTVLEECGVDTRRAKWVLAEGADGPVHDRSIPFEKMMDDALLAYGQNGEPLRRENGYPLRLVLPGWEGNTNVKWLRRLKIGTSPWMTRDETSAYSDLMTASRDAEGETRSWLFTMVMEAKSVIFQPSGGERIRTPTESGVERLFYPITGLAWSGRGAVRGVEVQIGDASRTPTAWGPWKPAKLDGPVLDQALTRFQLDWWWDGRPTRMRSRAVDVTGYVQPSYEELVAVRSETYYYHYNGIQTWEIDARGRVKNVPSQAPSSSAAAGRPGCGAHRVRRA